MPVLNLARRLVEQYGVGECTTDVDAKAELIGSLFGILLMRRFRSKPVSLFDLYGPCVGIEGDTINRTRSSLTNPTVANVA